MLPFELTVLIDHGHHFILKGRIGDLWASNNEWGCKVLVSIKKIKGLGIFSDFSANAELQKLKRYNVFYGDNGTGKTTLSNLFAALPDGTHVDHPDLDYAIETSAGDLVPGQKCTTGIRVFNADYVEANIGRFDGPIRPILIVGQENKQLADEVRKDEATLADREASIATEQKAITKLEKEKNTAFSAIAKTIGEATSGTTLRNFRKPDAEKAFAKLGTPQIHDVLTLEKHRATLQQQQQDQISGITIPPIAAGPAEAPTGLKDIIARHLGTAHKLAERTAQSAAIARLTANADIAGWVEAGLQLHRTHKSETCEFCAQGLPSDRISALAEHFSIEDQRLKSEIEMARALGTSILHAIHSVVLPAKSAFYSELRLEWTTREAEFQAAQTALSDQVNAVQSLLSRKLIERTVSLDPTEVIEPSSFLAAIDAMSEIVRRHNAKSADFEREKAEARTAIETHYLSGIHGQIAALDAEIENKRLKIETLTNGSANSGDARSLDAIRALIAGRKATISSAHAGSAELSKRIATFLGRTDLTFESIDDGYRVLRRGKAAKRLSEGEKTAIAFVYFIVHLNDNDFNIQDGIIVIDDPISSLDSSSIYQAFSFLKNAVKDAKQVILLTHNFDFLKLLLNWLSRTKSKSHYMLVCSEANGARQSRIAPLDSLLEKHPTEYHYLFKTLYHYRSDGTIQSCYHIPNVARKVLETFLEFHVPANGTTYDQLSKINFDEDKKTAIYKFTNNNSHITGKGFDPAIVAETQKNVVYLLEMIEAVAQEHFNGLKSLSE